MKCHKPTMRRTPIALAVASIMVIPTTHSGPLNLAQNALEIAPGAEPNIVILFDDSGSMDWEALMASGVMIANQPNGTNIGGSKGSVVHQPGCGYSYYYGVDFNSNTYGSKCYVAETNNWRFRNSDFNKLYFDPNKEYKPWPGLNKQGKPFTNIDVTKAPDNPYDPKEFIDLTKDNEVFPRGSSSVGFKYYTWKDDGDGLFENGEQTEFRIKNADAKTKQNFANWFSYYRSRDLVAKGALGFVLEDLTNARIGFTTINTKANNFPVASMNASALSGNKKALLDKIYGTPIPARGTPLRRNLRDVGKYFACQSGNRFDASGANCPIQPAPIGTCQQNYSLLMTDGFYNGGSPSVGNQDKNSSNQFDGGAFADGVSETLADVAMKYYKTDLSGLDNKVPTTKYDIARSTSLTTDDTLHQHMSTFTVGFGLKGSVSNFPTNPSTAFNWPNPFNSTLAKVDDLLHAAYNGRGNYLSAGDPTQLVTGLQEMFRGIQADSGAASAVAFNTQSIKTNSVAYRALYNPKLHNGDVLAHPVNQTTGVVDTNTTLWSAAEKLDEKLSGNNANNRNIITYRVNADGTKTGVPFNYDTHLTATQKSLLDNPVPFALPAGYGDNDGKIGDERLAYLRGDQTHEGDKADQGEFRGRLKNKGRLGDIIHSTPSYVGVPLFTGRDNAPYPTNNKYSSFASTYSNRTPMLYVGANDGMLHGFNATTGEEIFAYVPNVLFDKLTDLTFPDYVHKMYVDEKPSINDAFYNNAWHTVLIGALGAGGKGLFALDITSPTTFATEAGASNNVMWEFTSADDVDLGFTYSRPIITMTNAKDGSGEHIWAAIFGNGYNSSSADGDAALFIAKLSGGLDGKWVLNQDYYKSVTGKGKAESSDGLTPNGLGIPRAVDYDSNGTVDYIFVGDLQGNVWRFDLTSSNPVDWNNAANRQIIFTATDKNGKPQPIVNQPIVVRNPKQGLAGVIVVVGTGTWFKEDDIGSTDIQAMYGIWDDFTGSGYPVSKSELVEQDFINEVDQVSGFTVRSLTNNPVDYSKDNDLMGWRLDFDAEIAGGGAIEYPGERAVRRLFLIGNSLLTTTVIPNPALACAVLPGGFLIGIDPTTGGKSKTTVLFDLNNDGKFDGKDSLPNGTSVSGIRLDEIPNDPSFIGNRIVIQQHTGEITGFGANIEGMNTGRLSWRQLFVE
ncbi:pilus assembly protein [Spartinivicinus poritis]|uniref:PilC/PilY family type IV pilus protein n=1 Tax=Spartinivicinus poritis TaxID=2994640 RepID=A0ABT5UAH6_9GAMM|nr:PilC/PilY family type IV pilus protein [Spartinivicinus sp. A2-2]MDE1462552.1 PilC/PilY family type IV pilus protein [Spartinivicinus sp. A2-2]